MTGAASISMKTSSHHNNEASNAYLEHSLAPRINTDAVIVEALRREYPQLHLTVTPQRTCDLLSFADAGHAAAAPIDQEKDRLSWLLYRPSTKRMDGDNDGLARVVHFGKFLFEWNGKEFVLFIGDCRDGTSHYSAQTNQYILSSSTQATERLLIEAGRWSSSLHDEVWVFDGGYWQKSRDLWESVQGAEWENVILDEDMKKGLIRDVNSFFNGKETYQKLKVPWKRGIIYYGPPGNGKTISVKATMHMLYKRKDSVPTLYVKSLASYGGPEYAIQLIFTQARKYAPCYLVFEDLDSLITPSVRSYFLNEVDGLKNNDGILMVGSTNHLDQLDPGIAKRPSRFDRKYLFPNPSKPQRVAYSKFWQGKLADNKDIEFPDEICDELASITDGFSFAYMQEAFVAALLALAAREAHGEDTFDEEDCDNSQPESPQQMKEEDISAEPTNYAITKRSDISNLQWSGCVDWLHANYDFELDQDITTRGLIWTDMQGGKTLLRTMTDWAYIKPFAGEMDKFLLHRFEGPDDGLDRLPLWKELKKQVKNLKEEMDRDAESKKAGGNGASLSDTMGRLRV